jgi:hypothetical protein
MLNEGRAKVHDEEQSTRSSLINEDLKTGQNNTS